MAAMNKRRLISMKFEIRMPKFSPIVVLLVIGLNVWFTKEVFELIRDTGIEPSTLESLFFGFTTVELWCLKDIKKTKIKNKKEGEKNES